MKALLNYRVLVVVVLMVATANVRANNFCTLAGIEPGNVLSTSSYDFTDKSEKKSDDDEETTSKVYEPHFRVDNNLVSFNLLSLDESPAKVMVYNDDYNLLYTTTVKGGKNLGKRFDFSNADKGSYYIVVKHKKHIYSKTIEMM